MSRNRKPAPIIGSMWRNHVTGEIWTVVGVDAIPGCVELRREGCRDLAALLADFHLDWSEIE